MNRMAVAVCTAVTILSFLLVLSAGAATITDTISSGPGTNLAASDSFTFLCRRTGDSHVCPEPSGNLSKLYPNWRGPMGLPFVYKRQDPTSRFRFGRKLGISQHRKRRRPWEYYRNQHDLQRPATSGVPELHPNLSSGAYSVALSLNESIDPRLINATAVPATRSLSVTISGPTVLASPEPGSLGLVAFALGSLYGLSPRIRFTRRK